MKHSNDDYGNKREHSSKLLLLSKVWNNMRLNKHTFVWTNSFNTNSSTQTKLQLRGKILIPLYELLSAWCLDGTFWCALFILQNQCPLEGDNVNVFIFWYGFEYKGKRELKPNYFFCPGMTAGKQTNKQKKTIQCHLTQTFISFKIIHTNAYSHKHFFLDSV